jgi:hypothetical protein
VTATALTNNDRELAAYIEAAAELLETRGWTQGSYVDELGQFCMLGAVAMAVEKWGSEDLERFSIDGLQFWSTFSASDRVRSVVACLRDFGLDSCWNDRPGRTKAEVTQRLNDVAQILRRVRPIP